LADEVTVLELTQSNVDPGNCWQTAVACLLEVPASDLPDQVAVESAGDRYWNVLAAYLERHHGLMYTEVPEYQFSALCPVAHHVLIGPTVRTTEAWPVHHVVVGFQGEVVWDPHPTRAGLLHVEKWGVLTPLTDVLREQRARMRSSGNLACCACPTCATP
jgi:hypothetical protein